MKGPRNSQKDYSLGLEGIYQPLLFSVLTRNYFLVGKRNSLNKAGNLLHGLRNYFKMYDRKHSQDFPGLALEMRASGTKNVMLLLHTFSFSFLSPHISSLVPLCLCCILFPSFLQTVFL